MPGAALRGPPDAPDLTLTAVEQMRRPQVPRSGGANKGRGALRTMSRSDGIERGA